MSLPISSFSNAFFGNISIQVITIWMSIDSSFYSSFDICFFLNKGLWEYVETELTIYTHCWFFSDTWIINYIHNIIKLFFLVAISNLADFLFIRHLWLWLYTFLGEGHKYLFLESLNFIIIQQCCVLVENLFNHWSKK